MYVSRFSCLQRAVDFATPLEDGRFQLAVTDCRHASVSPVSRYLAEVPGYKYDSQRDARVGIWAQSSSAQVGEWLEQELQPLQRVGIPASLLSKSFPTFQEIAEFSLIIMLPHDVENIAFFNLQALGIPLLLPSSNLLAAIFVGNGAATSSAQPLHFRSREEKVNWLESTSALLASKGVIYFRTWAELQTI
eukprot:5218928-Amphidinium_carterae.1